MCNQPYLKLNPFVLLSVWRKTYLCLDLRKINNIPIDKRGITCITKSEKNRIARLSGQTSIPQRLSSESRGFLLDLKEYYASLILRLRQTILRKRRSYRSFSEISNKKNALVGAGLASRLVVQTINLTPKPALRKC